MTALEIHGAQTATLAEKMRYAEALAVANLLPEQYRKQPGNVLLALEIASSLGIAPMTAIQTVHVIEGKTTASSALISSLVRRAGHKLRVTGDDTKARAEIVRCDDPDFTFVAEWDWDRAVRAGLMQIKDGKPFARSRKGNPTSWETYTAAMLKARAITEVARDACQDALLGVQYTPEELGAVVDEDGVPVDAALRHAAPVQPVAVERVDTGTGEVTAEDDDAATWEALIDAAETVDELRHLWGKAKGLPDVQAAINARAIQLQQTAAEPVAEPVDEDAEATEEENGRTEEEIYQERTGNGPDDNPALDITPDRAAS